MLEVANLRVSYGAVEAVRGVDLSVSEGIVVILGANGAGKSSTLRAIAGQLPKAAGSVTWRGIDITRSPSYRVARAGLVLVPEGRRVFAPLSVLDNLLLGSFANRSKDREPELLQEVFELFPILADRRRQPAGLLSGGEQQMLAIARAMMSSPAMILMDEPSMGLSPLLVDTAMGAAQRIAQGGTSVLMAEQNASAALRIADRAIVLERGQVVLQGTAAEVSRDPAVVRAFLGASSND